MRTTLSEPDLYEFAWPGQQLYAALLQVEPTIVAHPTGMGVCARLRLSKGNPTGTQYAVWVHCQVFTTTEDVTKTEDGQIVAIAANALDPDEDHELTEDWPSAAVLIEETSAGCIAWLQIEEDALLWRANSLDSHAPAYAQAILKHWWTAAASRLGAGAGRAVNRTSPNADRDASIFSAFTEGKTRKELARKWSLSVERIKQIIRAQRHAGGVEKG